MKKFLLVLFALISLNSFAQLQVKEGSFKYVPGGVIEDKLEYTDGNDLPMALIKISTENIPEQERMRLVFVGNRATQIVKRPKTGSMWIYISADPATFIDIRHPDYGTYKYLIPEKLCDYCVYEMVLQYVPLTPAPEPVQQKKYHLVVSADQSDATIYIDDEPLDIGQASKLVTEGTTHTYKIECNLYHAETGSVTVTEKTVIEKALRPNFGYINITTAPEQGAKVFVDGEYLGVSPIKTDKLKCGTHTVRVMKDMFKMKEETFTVTDGMTTDALLNMAANFVNVTINTDTDSDIYVDDKYKGKGKWTGRLSEGGHIFEARKTSHKTSRATVDLVLGEAKTFTIDAPKPIYGSLEVNSTPMNATIYIDGKSYGETPNYINEMLVGEHELKLTKQGCAELKKTIVVKEGEALTINEKLQVISQQTLGNENVVEGKINGHEYVDLGLSVKWATCNVGANFPEEYGDYFAWGETNAKSSYTKDNSKTYGESLGDISGNSSYDAAASNWGGAWRMPTFDEIQELIDRCAWTWTTQNGVNGFEVTGPNGKSIFFPAAGYRSMSSLGYAGENGYYWSSTPYISNNYIAYRFSFDGVLYMDDRSRIYGQSVRPVIE